MARVSGTLLCVLLAVGCSSSSGTDDGASTATGGATSGTGAASAIGGSEASGGASATGGSVNASGGSVTETGGAAQSGGTSQSGGASATGGVSNDTLTWSQANLTNYTSYPDPGSEECVEYNGCTWAGYFAGVDGQQTEQWVEGHNIIAVHSKDFGAYGLKTLRLRQGTKQIDAVVYDECADSDCSGCCTQNATQNGLNFLIDIESYTMERFGSGDGIVEWACIDCE